MIQIERVEAIQFHKVMTAGRTSPLLLTCEKDSGETAEFVAKFAAGGECDASSLCAEMIAAQLATDLGLPIPTPVLVEWDSVFAGSVVEPQARQVVNASKPPAFGSTYVTDGFTTWASDRLLLRDARDSALAIFFFDAVIGNSDRGGMKPNILTRGSSFQLIDHEMAFRDYLLLGRPPPPWATGGMSGMTAPGKHIFASQLVNDRNLDFTTIHSAWAALSDAQVDGYEAALPSEWTGDPALARFAISRIKDCRDRINDCVTECRRVLDV